MAHRNGEIPTSALTPLSVGGHLLSAPAAAFEAWRRQAAADGRVLTITSTADAYRILAVQERVFLQRYIRQATGGGIYGDVRWYKGVRYVRRHGAAAAVPGTSNHGRGLAVDIANAGPFGGKFHDWMLKTGPALGWSNTEGRSVGEPWHWVHDGVTLVSSTTGSTAGLAPGTPIATSTITHPAPPVQEDSMFIISNDIPGHPQRGTSWVVIPQGGGRPIATTLYGDPIGGLPHLRITSGQSWAAIERAKSIAWA